MTKTLLWLDDYRDPLDDKIDWMVFSPIGRNVDVVWVTTFQEFTDYFMVRGMPDGICFDHDLGTHNGDGHQCAKWLVSYCLDNNKNIPPYSIQSANTVGKENINKLLKSFIKFRENED
jgi:hypothetical protein